MARRDDLDTPRGTPGGPSYDPDAFAQFAERLARFLGTGRYLAAQTILVFIWITLNVVGIVAALGPVPVHPAQPGLLHAGGVRGAADPAGAEPPGRPRPGRGRARPRDERPLARRHRVPGARDRRHPHRARAQGRPRGRDRGDRPSHPRHRADLRGGSGAVRGRRRRRLGARGTAGRIEAAPAGSYDCGVIARAHRAPCIAVVTMGLVAAGCGSQRSHTHSATHRVVRPGARRPTRPRWSTRTSRCPRRPHRDSGRRRRGERDQGVVGRATPRRRAVRRAVLRPAQRDDQRHRRRRSRAGDHDRRPGPGRGRQRVAAVRRAAHLD